MKSHYLLGLTFLVSGSLLLQAQPTLTYPDLVRRLTDLERLATLPAPGESIAAPAGFRSDRPMKVKSLALEFAGGWSPGSCGRAGQGVACGVGAS